MFASLVFLFATDAVLTEIDSNFSKHLSEATNDEERLQIEREIRSKLLNAVYNKRTDHRKKFIVSLIIFIIATSLAFSYIDVLDAFSFIMIITIPAIPLSFFAYYSFIGLDYAVQDIIDRNKVSKLLD